MATSTLDAGLDSARRSAGIGGALLDNGPTGRTNRRWGLLAASAVRRLRCKGQHMSPAGSVGANHALGLGQRPVRIDEPLEPRPEPATGWAYHGLGVVPGPGGQA